MGSFSIWHWLIVLAVVLLLFGGRGKISQIMGDFGKGLRSFKKGMREDEPGEEPAGGQEARRLETSGSERSAEVLREGDRTAKS